MKPKWCSNTTSETCFMVTNGHFIRELDCNQCGFYAPGVASETIKAMPMPAKDEKATYYDAGGISFIDYVRAKLTPEEYRGFLKANVIKYASRMGGKGTPERDAEKLEMYARWLTETMGKGE